MPAECEVDPVRRLVKVRVWGVFTPANVMETRAKFTSDPAFSPVFFQLFDISEVTVVDMTAQEVRAAAVDEVFSENSRRALVAPRDDVFGLSRMFAIFREIHGGRERIEVFRTLEEAEAWLAG